MTVSYCTLFDRNYLARALALVESLDRTHPDGYRLYCLCLDEVTRLVLTRLEHPALVPVALHELERGDAPLLAARAGRTLVEYYWTITPTLLLWVLANQPELETLVYVDADLFFFGGPDAIQRELARGSALVHRHAFSPDLAHLAAESGTFNVGAVGIRNDATGRAILRWWRERCLEWCFNRYEDGKMGDQLYLDAWPRRFPGVVTCADPGVGTAPWNHRNGPITADAAGRPAVGGQPITVYHFHALHLARPGLVVPSRHLAYKLTTALLRHCYLPYLHALERAQVRVDAALPGTGFGYSPEVATLEHVMLARHDVHGALRAAGLQTPPLELGAGWTCFPTPQLLG